MNEIRVQSHCTLPSILRYGRLLGAGLKQQERQKEWLKMGRLLEFVTSALKIGMLVDYNSGGTSSATEV